MQEPTYLSRRCQNTWIEFRIANKLQKVGKLTNMESTNIKDRICIATISSRFCGRSTCKSSAEAQIDGGYEKTQQYYRMSWWASGQMDQDLQAGHLSPQIM